MLVVRRIAPFSAFKVGFFINGILALIFGGCSLLPMIMTGGLMLLGSRSSGGGIGVMFGLIFYILIVFGSAVMGGVTGAIIAFIYNLISGPFGGLEVELVDSPSSTPAKREL